MKPLIPGELGAHGARATVPTIPAHVPPAGVQVPLRIHGAPGAHGDKALLPAIQEVVHVLHAAVVNQAALPTPGAVGLRAMLPPIPVHVHPAGAQVLQTIPGAHGNKAMLRITPGHVQSADVQAPLRIIGPGRCTVLRSVHLIARIVTIGILPQGQITHLAHLITASADNPPSAAGAHMSGSLPPA